MIANSDANQHGANEDGENQHGANPSGANEDEVQQLQEKNSARAESKESNEVKPPPPPVRANVGTAARQNQLRQALRRLRWTTFQHTLTQRLAASQLRIALAIACSLLFWFALFLIFLDAFYFLNRHRMISGPLIEMLFGLFFVSLLVMLLFSTGVILFAALFASREAEFLLVRPVPPDHVFAFKFQEAMFFSCWGFMLLGSPLITAYGITTAAPWYFYPLAVAYFMAFALAPGSAGALLCLLIARFLPRRRNQLLALVGGAVLLYAGFSAFRAWQLAEGAVLSQSWLYSLMQNMRLSHLPLLPSHWISKGLLASTYRDGMGDALFYFLVLLSNSLFTYLVTAYTYHLLYRGAYDRVNSGGWSRHRRALPRPTPKSPVGLATLEPIQDSETSPSGSGKAVPSRQHQPNSWWQRRLEQSPRSRQMLALIVKDIRTFLRDPLQLAQVMIFNGLLVLYFITLGRLNYYTDSPYWRNMIGFFNLAVTGLILSAFTSRFIFPLLSLEGQRIWILGLCPLSRDAILWSKFYFAAGGAVVVTFSLTLLSSLMLALDPFLIVLQLVTIVILAFGLAGIAVGLGARFPDMRESDPSKIAAGFGGTLNLVASLLFILLVVGAIGFPCHLYAVTLTIERGATAELEGAPVVGLTLAQFRFWLTMSSLFSLAVGAAACYLPMRWGIHHFRAMEF